jgi:hypothetical protein
LPEDSLTRTTAETRRRMAEAVAWPAATELLAQLVELTAIVAADMRLKGDPRKIPRPEFLTRGDGAAGGGGAAGRRDGFKQAIGVLKASSRGNAFITAAA